MILLTGILVLLTTVHESTSNPVHNDAVSAMENPDLFEGDILDWDGDDDRNAVVENYRKWPNATIPYVIDISLYAYRDDIRKTMDLIETQTCIRFVDKAGRDLPVYLRIFKGQGCYSRVGKTMGEQPLSLGYGCTGHGTMTHELTHAIGFYHEHSRSDRDDYLEIHYENIRDGYKSEFRKLKKSENLLLDEFDFNSIMLYGDDIFSKDRSAGLKTMTSKVEGMKLDGPYDKPGLSDSDIKRIKLLYQCP